MTRLLEKRDRLSVTVNPESPVLLVLQDQRGPEACKVKQVCLEFKEERVIKALKALGEEGETLDQLVTLDLKEMKELLGSPAGWENRDFMVTQVRAESSV